ncbi:type II TA system antitoxin MqsA family protein [Syntrophomonas wolfei]|jgi:putative zinc finger/helix-turn-helix YgiT family protein|uniref:type II TA system antitoxin MqsA family protein n=1 Tax=Syntrophomonas wolfei TaxID=863 RepID=UPI000773171E|nr:type II TA system antitoxin MqsA family protein [Syntrophomonas wolfei]
MQKAYCPVCQKTVPVKPIQKTETYSVRGLDVTIDAMVLACAMCGEDIFDAELDNANLSKAYEVYRKQFKVLSSEDIKSLRQKYNISQRTLAKLLEWSPATIYRYEKGNLPTPAHNECLKRLCDPMEFENLIRDKNYLLTENEKKNLQIDTDVLKHTKSYEVTLPEWSPCIQNGFKSLDINKLLNMTVYFTQSGLSKTALMKHLWLSDFSHFKAYGVSISGAVYAALPNGPALDNWLLFLQFAVNEEAIELEPIYYNDMEAEIVKANRSCQIDYFTSIELATIQKVARVLKGKTARQLSDLSHNEDAYKLTPKNRIISYEHAFSLQMLP